MKLWVVLVAVTLLAGCGAELATPQATPPPRKVLGFLGVLEEAAENATARLRGAPFVQKMQRLAAEAEGRARALGAGLRAEAAELWGRAAAYGAEARAWLELTWAELRGRGAAYGRKLRKRLHRDGEELRRRWGGGGGGAGSPPPDPPAPRDPQD